LVSKALNRANFEAVETKTNLGIAEFRQALRRFQSQANGAEVALVYFAGHGLEVNGANWLIPTDADLSDDRDLDYEAIKTDLVLQALQGARMRVLVLDACRNNPFGRNWRASVRSFTNGLAKLEADDVLVLFAAAPGRTASDGRDLNSPFAEALAKRLPEPGLAIQLLGGSIRDDVLAATSGDQRPYVSASITGKPFYLVPAEPAASAATQVPAVAQVPAASQASEAERAWATIKDTTGVAALEAFTARFKNTYYADLAQLRIEELKKQQVAVTTPPVPSEGETAKTSRLVRACDLVAASPHDQRRPADIPGVEDDKLDVRAAKAPCQAARDAAPSDPRVMFELGRILQKEMDHAKARALYEEAASQGYAIAQIRLGIFYIEGRGGLAKDDREGVRLLKLAADQGNALGQADLGFFYEHGGGGLAKDAGEAARLFKLSADQGNPTGQANLGVFYAQGGGGLAKDDAKAARLFKLAADQGNPIGQANLGVFYAQGRGGVAKDDRQAVRLFKLSADQGNPIGQANLGIFYEQGRGGLAKNHGCAGKDRQEVDGASPSR
jgi:TPR repeat protein/uncharacterized caspase-like protein